jgi:hypothetical protein
MNSVSVSRQRAKPEMSRVRNAGNAIRIAFIILPWATAGLSIGFAAYPDSSPLSPPSLGEQLVGNSRQPDSMAVYQCYDPHGRSGFRGRCRSS